MEDRKYTETEQKVLDFLCQRFDGVVAVELGEDGVLCVELSGSCADCPMKELSCDAEMKAAVEDEFPEIVAVSTRPYVSRETLDFARKLLGLK